MKKIAFLPHRRLEALDVGSILYYSGIRWARSERGAMAAVVLGTRASCFAKTIFYVISVLKDGQEIHLNKTE